MVDLARSRYSNDLFCTNAVAAFDKKLSTEVKAIQRQTPQFATRTEPSSKLVSQDQMGEIGVAALVATRRLDRFQFPALAQGTEQGLVPVVGGANWRFRSSVDGEAKVPQG